MPDPPNFLIKTARCTVICVDPALYTFRFRRRLSGSKQLSPETGIRLKAARKVGALLAFPVKASLQAHLGL